MHPSTRRAQLRHLFLAGPITTFATQIHVEVKAASDPKANEIDVPGFCLGYRAVAQNFRKFTSKQNEPGLSGPLGTGSQVNAPSVNLSTSNVNFMGCIGFPHLRGFSGKAS